MERDTEQLRHEEAIEPVRPGLRPGDRARTPATRRSWAAPLAAAAFIVLLAVAIAVFIALPNWVAPPQEQPATAAPAEPQPEPDAAPALSAEERAALREQADELLAELLSQQRTLAGLGAENWAPEDWPRYDQLARDGDDTYLADDYAEAVALYGQALELGSQLLARADTIKSEALAAAQAAFEAGDAARAIEQYEIVLGLEPDHAQATLGRNRARRLPDVLAHVLEAERAARDGQLAAAADAYRAALEVDGRWAPARNGLEDVERRIAQAQFDRVLSRGYSALESGSHGDAAEAFREALQMRPGSREAADGLQQAEQGAKLGRIALAQARALAFEGRELWSRAIEQYDEALRIDDTLAFAHEGRERARARHALDAKLQNLIDSPGLLFRDDVLNEARALIDEAGSVLTAAAADTGSTERLASQIEHLGDLVAAASRPLPVEFVSDGQTEVTLYRVGSLGRFASTEVELRPGNYTAVGSRVGYRDVRQTFTVIPGRELPPITIICTEPI